MITDSNLSSGSSPDAMHLNFGNCCIITVADEICTCGIIASFIIPSFMKYSKLFACILIEVLI